MKRSRFSLVAVLTTIVVCSTGARADVIRVATNEFRNSADFDKYAQTRAENDKYLKAQRGFVSVTWFSDRKGLIAGATTVWKTPEDANSAYGASSYKEFNQKNIAPYVKSRSVHLFRIDQVE
jgi:hypothetical protein